MNQRRTIFRRQRPLFGSAGRLGVLGVILLAVGCSNEYRHVKHFVQAEDDRVGETSYRIEPPDIIAISSPVAPEVDGEAQMVRSDGKISLKLIGEVKVANLTPRELAAKLEDLLSRYYQNPKVNVRISAYNSKYIYVFGEVGSPGRKPYTGRDSLLNVLAKSQPTFLAWEERIKIIRPSASPDERHEIIVNAAELMQSGDLRSDFLLKEGDIVYVPPTPLAWVGLRMRELLYPFQPVMSAYQMPASMMATTDYYQNRDRYYNYDDADDNSLRRQALMMLLR